MDFQIVFSPSARKDLREIVKYIAAEDQRTAERIGMALILASKSLTKFPRKGRVVPVPSEATRHYRMIVHSESIHYAKLF